MPLEDLLAFYGYEPTIPVIAGSSADSSPSELADELPDMTLDKVSQKHFYLYLSLKLGTCVIFVFLLVMQKLLTPIRLNAKYPH